MTGKRLVNPKKGKKGKVVTSQLNQKRIEAISNAIEAGVITYKNLCKYCSITESILQCTFKANPSLHKKYKVALIAVKHKAADNIVTAVMDSDHPKNFEATKLFISRYKTPLDEVFEPVTNEISIDSEDAPTGTKAKITINFTPQNTRV